MFTTHIVCELTVTDGTFHPLFCCSLSSESTFPICHNGLSYYILIILYLGRMRNRNTGSAFH